MYITCVVNYVSDDMTRVFCIKSCVHMCVCLCVCVRTCVFGYAGMYAVIGVQNWCTYTLFLCIQMTCVVYIEAYAYISEIIIILCIHVIVTCLRLMLHSNVAKHIHRDTNIYIYMYTYVLYYVYMWSYLVTFDKRRARGGSRDQNTQIRLNE